MERRCLLRLQGNMIRCSLAKFETLAASMPGDAVLPGDTIAYYLWGSDPAAAMANATDRLLTILGK
jgi:hypothetical protein